MKRNAALLALLCMALVSCGKKSENIMVVTNHSGITADQIAVTVCDKDYMFSNVKNGETVSKNFVVKYESSFSVSVLMEDGVTSTNGFGFVAPGTNGVRAEIEINEDKKVVGTQK